MIAADLPVSALISLEMVATISLIDLIFSRGTRAQHLALCVWCVVCGVWCAVVSPGWMRCSDQSEREDNCTVTISVYSTCVHTAVGRT